MAATDRFADGLQRRANLGGDLRQGESGERDRDQELVLDLVLLLLGVGLGLGEPESLLCQLGFSVGIETFR